MGGVPNLTGTLTGTRANGFLREISKKSNFPRLPPEPLPVYGLEIHPDHRSIYPNFQGGQRPKYLHELSEKNVKIPTQTLVFQKKFDANPPVVKNKSA